jgi:hypothetical protein
MDGEQRKDANSEGGSAGRDDQDATVVKNVSNEQEGEYQEKNNIGRPGESEEPGKQLDKQGDDVDQTQYAPEDFVTDVYKPGDTNENQQRRSERPRKLTYKAKENKAQEVAKTIWYNRNGLLPFAEGIAHRDLSQVPSKDLSRIEERLENGLQDITSLFDEYRDLVSEDPDSDLVRAVDQVSAMINRAALRVRRANERVNEPSVFSIPSALSHVSSRSSRASSIRREMILKTAALQVELQCQAEEAAKEEEILRLEVEEARRRVEVEAQLKMKQRELARQGLQKQLRIEQAKLEVFEHQEALE